MMNEWQTLAAQQTPDASAFPDCALTNLGHLGLIRVGGADQRSFLQGQLTNDIHKVTAERIQLSSHCSPKGRMLGSFWILQRDEELYLQMPRARLEAILKRLRMFVLRAKVQIDDVSDDLPGFGLSGACAEALLPFTPEQIGGCITRDGLSVIRMPGQVPRFQLIAPPQALAGLWTRLRDAAEPSGADFWALLDIRAGIPSVVEDTAEAFVPQMANMQLIDGVSFTKGCYTGQEVVARMQYLGKLKRRMYRVRIPAGDRPGAGAEIYSPSSESGQGAGRIVAVAPSPQGGFEALAVVQISCAEMHDLQLGDAQGPRIEILDLPYPFAAVEP